MRERRKGRRKANEGREREGERGVYLKGGKGGGC